MTGHCCPLCLACHAEVGATGSLSSRPSVYGQIRACLHAHDTAHARFGMHNQTSVQKGRESVCSAYPLSSFASIHSLHMTHCSRHSPGIE
eukprot:6186264-Pleurochrysis_carterae.AAC.3